MLPATVAGQSYVAMWKQADEAAGKDLPKTQMEVLGRIAAKAEAAGDYGQLLKAELLRARVGADIAPDSLLPAVERMEQRRDAAADAVLRSVYAAVLYRIYSDNPTLVADSKARADSCRRLAMASPEALAAARSADYEPMVIDGYNSKIFGGDMLSVIGYEVEDFGTLYEHYREAGNRRASCLAALELIRQHKGEAKVCVNKSEYVNWLDSLIGVYSDLDVACEAAIERYNYMEQCPGVTVEEKISYIHYALDKWGGWQNAGQLRNAEKRLTAPSVRVEMERRVVGSGVAQELRLRDLRNVSSVSLKLYRADIEGDTKLNPAGDADYKKLRPLLAELKDRSVERHYLSHPDYQFFDDSIAIGGLPAGVYMLEVRTSPATEAVRWLYYVTDMYLMSQVLPGNRIRYVAVNSTTGQPVAGAKIRLVTADPRSGKSATATITCGSDGEAVYAYAKRKPGNAFVYTASDRYCPDAGAYGAFSYYSANRRDERTYVFTDRSVYRPGQTVRVGAVVTECTDFVDSKAVGGKKVKAVLRDANFKVVAEKDVTTDGYGTCAADFVLPTGTLNGRFTVMVNNSSAAFRVEEYKRPTFRVEFPKINEKYQAGDTLVVKAKALSFAGVPVQGARVKYTVSRRRAWWWMPKIGGNVPSTEQLWQGEGVTDADGSFTVVMPMALPEQGVSQRMFFNIVARADVTDVGGETRSGEVSVPLGSKPTAFSCDLDDKELADSLRSLTFTLRNASGESIKADVRFRIDGSGEWLSGKTAEPIKLTDRLASGRHRLFAVCEADTIDRDFVVFALDDTVPCVNTCGWFYASDEAFRTDGQPVTVQVGSSDDSVHVVYSIFSGDSIVESGVADISNELINRKFTYKEEYGNGLLLTYAWVKDGQCHAFSKELRRPLPDRKLRLKWTTFRDRLVPGQQEEWRLSVAMPDGTPARAQLMATLYDKSLDEIAAHSWSLEPQSWLPMPYAAWSYPQWWSVVSTAVQSWKSFAFRPLEVSRFDPLLFPYYGGKVFYSIADVATPRPMMRASGANSVKRLAKDESAASASYDAVAESEALAGVAVAPKAAQMATDGSDAGGSADQLRENLNETAFFMPALETDSTGTVTLKFTLPESLTTWRFMGVAHTSDMYCGSIEGEAVAKKDLMVQPNVPRFVRVGDKARITARVFNTSTVGISGTARMELIDPETEKTVLSRTDRFSVEAGATAAVGFDYSPDGTQSLLICRVTATGGGFTDGEQHYLPVLPDRERVTITVPLTQHGAGTKSVRIDTLFRKGSSDRKLTIEYTNSPAWLMVQALPSVGTARDDNAIDQAAAFYANALGHSIISRSPRIKTVFDSWRMESAESQTLTSSLAKNAELKDIVLGETPWMADADSETEQKQRLADFFDESLTQARMVAAADKLRSLQNADGSWSWCPGMAGNLMMTVEVAEMLTRLNLMAGRQEQTEAMLDKAFDFMGKRIVEQVRQMRAAEKKGVKPTFPGSTALRYLYLCAIDGRKQVASVDDAANYLVNLLKKDVKGQSIYDKALTAIVLAKRGEGSLGREYVQSLKEYTVFSEEQGRYYDTPRAGYSWRDYRIPTEVAAMEAIATIAPEDSTTLDEMRRWLLTQKRTQAWDTPINSVNAVYAFLAGGAALLESGERTALAIDGEAIDAPQATAGLGYVKVVVHEPKGKTFTATKANGGTSWGALYAQSMQNTSAVEASGSGISVRREVVSDSATLRVGSRVKVRITIRAERDLDFVQVSDRRAACMEPAEQLSGYRNGAYCSPKDNVTNYFFDRMAKGTHVIETTYYIDRAGRYETGTCAVGCAYAPEYRATAPSTTIEVKE